jgi:DNA-binding Lrp family transcriptional regulator
MDDTDLAILRAMGARRYGPTAPPREDLAPAVLARKLGIDASTVQARVDRMREAGFLRAIEIRPNLRLFDLQERVHFYDELEREAKARAMERLELVDGLLEAHDYWGGTLCVVLTYRSPSDLARKESLLRELLGRPGRPIFERARPPLRDDLDKTDWRVLRSLRRNALQTPADVAADVGVSAKTARRRMEKLAHAQAYFVNPLVDPRQGDGFVVVGYLLQVRAHDRPRVLQRVREALGDRTFLDEDAQNGAVYLLGGFRNVDEATRAEKLMAGTDGVERIEPYILQGARSYSSWIDDAIDARIENMPG